MGTRLDLELNCTGTPTRGASAGGGLVGVMAWVYMPARKLNFQEASKNQKTQAADANATIRSDWLHHAPLAVPGHGARRGAFRQGCHELG